MSKVVGWIGVVLLLVALLSVWGAGPSVYDNFALILLALLVSVVVPAIAFLATKPGSTGFGVVTLLFGLTAIVAGVLALMAQQPGVGAMSILGGVLFIAANFVGKRSQQSTGIADAGAGREV